MASDSPGASAGLPALRLAGTSYQYPGTARSVLEGIDLEVAAGEAVGVVGANESGKTTLCLVASGAAPVSIGGRLEGSVTLRGVETRSLRPFELAQRCGLLFQNPATQLSGTSPTVYEEIAFGPRNLGLGLPEVVERVEESIGTLGIEALSPRDPARLSGGQAQLVALASVLALRPELLILDEPTSQLDPEGTRLVGEALRRLARAGSALLIVEHKTDLLERLADRVVALADARIVLSGPARSVLGDSRLAEIGVEPPSSTRLSAALRRAGADVSLELLVGVAG